MTRTVIVEAVEERHEMLSVPGLSRQSARVIFDRCLKCASFDFQGTYLANFKRCPTPMLAQNFYQKYYFPSFLEFNLNWRCGEDLQKLCHSVHIERRSHWRVDLHLKLFTSLNELLAGRANYSLMTYIRKLRDFSRFPNVLLIYRLFLEYSLKKLQKKLIKLFKQSIEHCLKKTIVINWG